MIKPGIAYHSPTHLRSDRFALLHKDSRRKAVGNTCSSRWNPTDKLAKWFSSSEVPVSQFRSASCLQTPASNVGRTLPKAEERSYQLAREGAALRLAGDTTAAKYLLNQAIVLSKKNNFALLNRCALTLERVHADLELKVIGDVLDREPKNQFALFCLAAYYKAHLYSDLARETMINLVAINPLNDAAQAGLALLHAELGDEKSAVLCACTAMELNPRNGAAFSLLLNMGFPGPASDYRKFGTKPRDACCASLFSILENVELWLY